MFLPNSGTTGVEPSLATLFSPEKPRTSKWSKRFWPLPEPLSDYKFNDLHSSSASGIDTSALSLGCVVYLDAPSFASELSIYINENWRWQHPIRQLKVILDQERIGTVFRARIDYRTNFPVFDNQPILKELEQFILSDIGSHIRDAAERFLFGDSQTLYCQTCRVHPDIKGEDVPTVMLKTKKGATVICDMSYASRKLISRSKAVRAFWNLHRITGYGKQRNR